MALPLTPLMSAPSDAICAFGASMSSYDLLKGLRRVNPNIVVPEPEHFKEWYPGKIAGMTCLWLGKPGDPDSIKISAFHLGMVPEWTLYDGQARQILRKGWRTIFDRVIRAKAATRRALEAEFKVSLTYDGRDGVCPRCFKDGVRVKSTCKSGLCDTHDSAQKMAADAKELKREVKHAATHPTKRQGPMVFLTAT